MTHEPMLVLLNRLKVNIKLLKGYIEQLECDKLKVHIDVFSPPFKSGQECNEHFERLMGFDLTEKWNNELKMEIESRIVILQSELDFLIPTNKER